MEKGETAGDADNSTNGQPSSESLTMEGHSSSPRASENFLPGNSGDDAVVDSDREKEKEPALGVLAEVEGEELSEANVEIPPSVDLAAEKVAVETSEDKSVSVEVVSKDENTGERCEEESKLEVAGRSESPNEEQNRKETESSEVLGDKLPCEEGGTVNNESPSVIIDEVSRGSGENTVCESNNPEPRISDDNVSVIENALQDDAVTSNSAISPKNALQDDNIASNAEEPQKISEFSETTEKNDGVFDENDVEVIADGPTGCTVVEEINKENQSTSLHDTPLPTKRPRMRQKKNLRPPESTIENGTPEAEVHADEISPGRPRRKAAQKAGDQIKQIVGSEEEISEILEKVKETEWSAEPKTETPPRKICYQCCRLRPCQYHLLVNGVSRYMCTTPCFQAFRKFHPPRPNQVQNEMESGIDEVTDSTVDIATVSDVAPAADIKAVTGKERTLECAFCHRVVPPPTSSDKSLSWETMEFCNEGCLGKYQDQLSASCSQCRVRVQRICMGKYCVRFGYNIKQFCCSTCLEEFKKGLKTCTYCQKDISTGGEGFLAPVGDKGQFKDFCSPACMEQYDHISSGTRPQTKEAACAVCDKVRPVISEVVTRRLGKNDESSDSNPPVYSLCSDPCFAAFKFVNEVKAEQCESCLRYFDTSKPEEKPTIFFHDGGYHCCCRACLNIFILKRRSIVQCNWCRVKKYDFDMIKRMSSSGQVLMMCSLNCLSLYHVSISAVSSRKVKCDFCKEVSQAQYHLTMSDATVRNFCSYDCVMTFQSQYSKAPLTLPEEDVTFSSSNLITGSSHIAGRKVVPLTVQSGPVPAQGVEPPSPAPVPVISAVQSLAADRNIPMEASNSVPTIAIPSSVNDSNAATAKVAVSNSLNTYRQLLKWAPGLKEMKNKSTSCRPFTHSKSIECEILPEKPSVETSTVDTSTQTDEFFLRGPILIPVPVPIYVPAPMAMYSHPFPVPTPFPLPIPVPILIPSKLSLKEIVQKYEVLSSVTPEEAEILMIAELVADENKDTPSKADSRNSNSPVDGDTHSDADAEVEAESAQSEPLLPDTVVDLEEDIIISKVPGPAVSEDEASADDQESDKAQVRKPRIKGRGKGGKSKRPQPPLSENELEDDPNGLKATLGVSAWQVWVQQKNSELSKVTSNSRRLKLFKTELLQMTLEELNYALCLFVKEVRKPGGGMYAPDTIFYFCLGIQHYLMENGRIDNIFTDLYFEKFTECLDQVATTFPPLTKETKLIETRVEEEHLWESRQLGAHSPYVLLSTLVFFNTKYFHLWTVEDHSKLTFANVIKVWKKPRSRHAGAYAEANSSLLRLIHPDKVNDENNTPRKVYEQEENDSIPIRCPVKHYEFYLSKCPDPLKKVGDLFYLLPERACVPDSPVWYSSTALGPDALSKILHRIQMVKEVNKSYAEELAESMEEKSSEEKESTD
ncbi:zinc finger MYM-type protein 3 [Hetaerina americana]|uniref:zinc finger MYM-type protein 3 n=1 Tax=Hetaerina americana TaxID=62018 RepID=UPI003A7F2075